MPSWNEEYFRKTCLVQCPLFIENEFVLETNSERLPASGSKCVKFQLNKSIKNKYCSIINGIARVPFSFLSKWRREDKSSFAKVVLKSLLRILNYLSFNLSNYCSNQFKQNLKLKYCQRVTCGKIYPSFFAKQGNSLFSVSGKWD